VVTVVGMDVYVGYGQHHRRPIRGRRAFVDRPRRGTRPANRRELILSAAEGLFYRQRYVLVSMKDIADEVAVGPSALYRHFRNKEELLAAILDQRLIAATELIASGRIAPADGDGGAPVPDSLDSGAGTAPDSVRRLGVAAVRFRFIGALWRRDAGHLSERHHDEIRSRIVGMRRLVSDDLRRRRPELTPIQIRFLIEIVFGVATSVSFHSRPVSGDWLTGILDAVAAAPLPPIGPEPAHEGSTSWSPSRRAELLSAATRLFAERGFPIVSVEEIGAEVGIAGASIYNHFQRKSDLLQAAIGRGADMLRVDLERAIERAAGPADALERLIVSYRGFSLENPSVIRVLNSELDYLDPADRSQARARQREYVGTWMDLLRRVRPEFDEDERRVRVQAVFGVIDTVATTESLCRRIGTPDAVDRICRLLLGLPAGSGAAFTDAPGIGMLSSG
jgi:AcrR family transcriptional regulator